MINLPFSKPTSEEPEASNTVEDVPQSEAVPIGTQPPETTLPPETQPPETLPPETKPETQIVPVTQPPDFPSQQGLGIPSEAIPTESPMYISGPVETPQDDNANFLQVEKTMDLGAIVGLVIGILVFLLLGGLGIWFLSKKVE